VECVIHCYGVNSGVCDHKQLGLAVLMASAVVVLNYETSTLRQRHNFISIDLKFGVGDYVRSHRPEYTFQLTGYATDSNEKNIFAVLYE